MAYLRGPEGCPWDRAQDYASVKGLLLEEAYEVIDAVNARDFAELEEELGDLLFQVIFYARLAEEEKRFSIDDVIEGIHAKLVRRHPHVFGEKRARTPEEALESWRSVKEQEKIAEGKAAGRTSSAGGIVAGISPSLPATLEAYELGLRAAEVGFDWANVRDLLDKIKEEVKEIELELALAPAGRGPRLEEEVGDLLFTAANLARRAGSDPESALRHANSKFKARFEKLEAAATRRGKRVEECSAEELDALWTEAKAVKE
jgi:nucleoside triphosphate diphosphatase